MIGGFVLRAREQRRRIALLAGFLQPYGIERLMETLAEGYLRALGEQEPQRQAQIWALMGEHEGRLSSQLRRLTEDLARADARDTRVFKWAWSLQWLDQLVGPRSFDLRKAIAIHANGIDRLVRNEERLELRDKAYALCAEMFLLQHTCHWYCRSKAVASARLLARHKTSYAQVLAAVSEPTRSAYLALTAP